MFIYAAMVITSKHKIYGGLLGAGLIALVADKAFLSPTSAAANDPVAAEYAASSQASVLDSARSDLALVAPVVTAEASNIIEQLSHIAQAKKLDLDHIHDAFEPSKAWQTTSDDVIQITTTGDGPASRFLKKHRLLAVMGSGESASIIINKTCLFIDDEIAGFTFTSVEDGVVELESNGLKVQLELPKPSHQK